MLSRAICLAGVTLGADIWAELEQKMQKVAAEKKQAGLDEMLEGMDLEEFTKINLESSGAESISRFDALYQKVVTEAEFAGSFIVSESEVPDIVLKQRAKEISLSSSLYPSPTPTPCTGKERCDETAATGLTTPCGIFRTATTCPAVLPQECSGSTRLGASCHISVFSTNTCGLMDVDGATCPIDGTSYLIMQKISCKKFYYKCPRGQYLEPVADSKCVWRWVAVKKFVPCANQVNGCSSSGYSTGCACGCEKVFWVKKLLCPCVCVDCPTTSTATTTTATTTTMTTTSTLEEIFCVVNCEHIVYEPFYKTPTSGNPGCVKAVENTQPAADLPINACPCHGSHGCGCGGGYRTNYARAAFLMEQDATVATKQCCARENNWTIDALTLQSVGVAPKEVTVNV